MSFYLGEFNNLASRKKEGLVSFTEIVHSFVHSPQYFSVQIEPHVYINGLVVLKLRKETRTFITTNRALKMCNCMSATSYFEDDSNITICKAHWITSHHIKAQSHQFQYLALYWNENFVEKVFAGRSRIRIPFRWE